MIPPLLHESALVANISRLQTLPKMIEDRIRDQVWIKGCPRG